ncbi:MAG: hypothetical protein Q7S88_02000 [Candidatus Daviesbacteria bacterium]|nr:hypothetical protein [Candidatus Daviesbacteria bacterium]
MVDKEPRGITQDEINIIHPNLSFSESLMFAAIGYRRLRLDREYIDELLNRTEPAVVEQIPDEKIAEMIGTVLNPLETRIVNGHVGFFDGQTRTFTALGRELGIDRRKVGRIFKGAVIKLRPEPTEE